MLVVLQIVALVEMLLMLVPLIFLLIIAVLSLLVVEEVDKVEQEEVDITKHHMIVPTLVFVLAQHVVDILVATALLVVVDM